MYALQLYYLWLHPCGNYAPANILPPGHYPPLRQYMGNTGGFDSVLNEKSAPEWRIDLKSIDNIATYLDAPHPQSGAATPFPPTPPGR